MSKGSPPGYTEGDWAAIVAWLTGAGDIAVTATGAPMGAAATAEYAARRAGELIGMRWDAEVAEWVESAIQKYRLDAALRDALHEVVEDGISKGYGYAEIRADLDAFLADEIPGRALTIARTETGFAYNAGALAGYAAQGVEKVIVHDGQEPNSCSDCAALEGAEWTVEEAAADPLGHPNCSRAFEPLIPEDWEESNG